MHERVNTRMTAAASVVFVHGIRTSHTMWRAQLEHLAAAGVPARAVDLPGHGTRMREHFTLDAAFATIRDAVDAAAANGKVLLVGHSLGGILSLGMLGMLGSDDPPPVDRMLAACCTAIPRGGGLAAYRALLRAFDRLPGRGDPLAEFVMRRTLPIETRDDFTAGGVAYRGQHEALRAIRELDMTAALPRISVPTTFVNGRFDQLRIHEQRFVRSVPGSTLTIVPNATHLLPTMRPHTFAGFVDRALAVL